MTDFAILLREGIDDVRVRYDRHVEGIFPRATWLDLLRGGGLRADGRRTEPGSASSSSPGDRGSLDERARHRRPGEADAARALFAAPTASTCAAPCRPSAPAARGAALSPR